MGGRGREGGGWEVRERMGAEARNYPNIVCTYEFKKKTSDSKMQCLGV
jgi:hypothetical protein